MNERTQFFIADEPPTVAAASSPTAIVELRDVHERVLRRLQTTADTVPRTLLATAAEAIAAAFNGWRYLPERHEVLAKWLADPDKFEWLGNGHPLKLLTPSRHTGWGIRWLGGDDDPGESLMFASHGIPSPARLLADDGRRLRRTIWDPERGPVRGWIPDDPTWTEQGPAFPPLRDPVMLHVWSGIFLTAAKQTPTHRGKRLARDWARTRDAAAAPAAQFWQQWADVTNRNLQEAWAARTPPAVDVTPTHDRRGPIPRNTITPRGIPAWR